LPKYDQRTDTLSASKFVLAEASPIVQSVVRKLALLRIVRLYETDGVVECNNFTVINFILIHFGPLKEDSLVKILLAIQVLSSVLAFGIRFFMAGLVYETVH